MVISSICGTAADGAQQAIAILELGIPDTARVVDYDDGIYAVGTSGGALYIINETGEYTVTAPGAGSIWDVRIENPFIAVAAGSSTVLKFSIDGLTPVEQWRRAVSGQVRAVDISCDGAYAAYLSTSSVGVFNSDGMLVSSYSISGAGIVCWLDATCDMEYIAITAEVPPYTGTNSGVELYRFNGNSISHQWGKILINKYETTEVRVSEAKDYIAVATSSGTYMNLLDLPTGDLLWQYETPNKEQYACDGDDNLKYVIGANQAWSPPYPWFVLKNPGTSYEVVASGNMNGPINDLDSNPDSSLLAFGSDIGEFILLRRSNDSIDTVFEGDVNDVIEKLIDAIEIGGISLLVGGQTFINLYTLSPLRLEKVDDVNDGDCVGPGDEINYRIDYNYPAWPSYFSFVDLADFVECWLRTDCNSNNNDCDGMDMNTDGTVNFIDFALFAGNWLKRQINYVNIIDELPEEVDFNSASAGGVYNSDSHTVTWDIGTLSPGESGSVMLKVKVRCAEPDGTIINHCEMRGDGINPLFDNEDTPVCSPTLTKVDDVPDGNCVAPDANTTYSICYAANGYGDTNVEINDVLSVEVSFVRASNGGVYHPGSHTVTWNIGTLEPSESGCRTLTVDVNSHVPGDTITSCCRMTGDCMTSGVTACEDTPVCAHVKLDMNASTDNNDANTEPGFTAFEIDNSGSEVNGVIIDLSGDLDSFRRANPTGVPYEQIYRDFIFGTYPSGVTITLWGLGANRKCAISIYSFDNNSTPTRLADWTANGEELFTTDFNGGVANWPDDINDYRFSGEARTDKFGRIVLESTRDAESPAGQNFAFVNALLLGPKGVYVPVPYAQRPVPFDEEEDVPTDVVLSWKAGAYADRHDIYLGTDFNDVNNCNRANHHLPAYSDVLFDPNKTSNNYDPYGAIGLLKLDTTYYWRVDEVNDAPPTITKGEIWSFKTVTCSVIEDFDSYTSSQELQKVWRDGWTNGTMSEVFRETAAARVHTGYSMKYQYTNAYDPYYAEADATMTALGMDPNWLGMNAKALSLWFYGQTGNDANEQMYIKLTDGASNSAAVVYDGDPNDVKEATWHEWNIDLEDFNSAGVDLTNVTRITIGFGLGVAPVGSGDGTVYFDDILLCATRCVLSKRLSDFALADYAPGGAPGGDCEIDYREILIMAATWLAQDNTIGTKNPGTTNLTARYHFDEGIGKTTINSAPGADPCSLGYLSPKNPNDTRERPVTWVTPGAIGNSAINFDGSSGCRINCGRWDPLPGNSDKMTLAIWAKWAGPHLDRETCQGLISKRVGWNASGVYFMFEVDTIPAPRGSFSLRQFNSAYSVWSPSNILDSFIGNWVHLAATVDPTVSDANQICKLYLNATQVTNGRFEFGGGNPSQIDLTIGQISDVREQGVESFNGDLDEAYIFNRVLEVNEIAYLADVTPGDGYVYVPVPSAAELYEGEPEGERKVNFKDFAILAKQWLKEELWP